ncbi:enhanced serine sensitivity protein SseB C-terminal domain-containing protein [Bartonella sp. HY761]|uniref:enhanced serine sensitivity protein SseB C-terminal domain-containing protein n=1 Tax=Bartonella sp. HY761 TaxID=2979330 RepID=UPI002206497F|nr:enhanced serine sensitivity protein SseB C-terminal domain-containing protein [Bartonella sp. HY761]UXN05935.1 enhanced serine sensitivity protein SseB C-terminal domain-containing protein [Bartonella sp. HY761]
MFSKIRNFFSDKLQKKITDRQFSTEEDASLPTTNDQLPLLANPGLIAAITTLRNEENAENRIRFQNLMKESRFILVTTKLSAMDKDDRVIFDHAEDEHSSDNKFGIALTARNEKLYYLIFTDMDRFNTWQQQHDNDAHSNSPNSQPNLIAFANLCDLIMETPSEPYGILINPKCEDFLVQHEFFKMVSVEAQLQMSHNEGTKVTLQTLEISDLSENLVNELNDFFKKTIEIHAVWAVIMVMEQQQYFTLIIDCSGNHDDIFPKILNICAAYIGEDEKTTAVQAEHEPFKSLVEQFAPIFIRAH